MTKNFDTINDTSQIEMFDRNDTNVDFNFGVEDFEMFAKWNRKQPQRAAYLAGVKAAYLRSLGNV